MPELITGFLLSAGGSVVGYHVNNIGRNLRRNRVYGRLLNFGSDDIIFVIAHREHGEQELLPRMATEDFMAINNILGALSETGWRGRPRIRDVRHLSESEKSGNLVSLGGGKVNSFTAETIEAVASRGCNPYRFVQYDSEAARWLLKSKDGEFHSGSYEVSGATREQSPNAETLEDIGILAKLTNPRNTANKILLVAGLRGVGTWGAAEHLRKQGRDLYRRKRRADGLRKNGDFFVLIKVQYRNYDILQTEARDFRDLS